MVVAINQLQITWYCVTSKVILPIVSYDQNRTLLRLVRSNQLS